MILYPVYLKPNVQRTAVQTQTTSTTMSITVTPMDLTASGNLQGEHVPYSMRAAASELASGNGNRSRNTRSMMDISSSETQTNNSYRTHTNTVFKTSKAFINELVTCGIHHNDHSIVWCINLVKSSVFNYMSSNHVSRLPESSVVRMTRSIFRVSILGTRSA